MLRRRNAELIGLCVQRTQKAMQVIVKVIVKVMASQREVVHEAAKKGRFINRANI